MAKDIYEWIKKVEAARPAMFEMAMRLQEDSVTVESDGNRERVVDSIPFIATFTFPGGVSTSLFFSLMDAQTDSDVVITHITTLPRSERSRSFGSQALKKFLTWAGKNGLSEVRATQVSNADSQRFWNKNGFVRCPPPNRTGDYIYQC